MENKELIINTPGQGNEKNKYCVYMPCEDNNQPFYVGKGECGSENGTLEKGEYYNKTLAFRNSPNSMKKEFIYIAGLLNKLDIVPLLFGSLGLEQRLNKNLNADDIDVLIPEVFLNEGWGSIVELMSGAGYTLYDLHEHAFEKSGLSAAFAEIESLTPFAGVDLKKIPVIQEDGVQYYLLDLRDYLKVYTASAKDGYRKNVKNKQDEQKIELIKAEMCK